MAKMETFGLSGARNLFEHHLKANRKINVKIKDGPEYQNVSVIKTSETTVTLKGDNGIEVDLEYSPGMDVVPLS